MRGMGILLMMTAAALASRGGPVEVDPRVQRSSEPVGPGNDYRGRWTGHPPLPKPASQAKRRRKARRRH